MLDELEKPRDCLAVFSSFGRRVDGQRPFVSRHRLHADSDSQLAADGVTRHYRFDRRVHDSRSDAGGRRLGARVGVGLGAVSVAFGNHSAVRFRYRRRITRTLAFYRSFDLQRS